MPTAITRLTTAWHADYETFQQRDRSDRDHVYIWADSAHFRIRPEGDRLCARVMIGVRPDGTKELIAIEDGYRESTESWAARLLGAPFEGDYGAKYPKAVASLRRDEELRLAVLVASGDAELASESDRPVASPGRGI